MTQPRYITVNTKYCRQHINISHIECFRPSDQGADFKTLIILASGEKVYSLDHKDYIVQLLTNHGAIWQ